VIGTAIAVATVAPSVAAAGGSSDPEPSAGPPTCAERFPDPGPAGVDLRLGCIVSEVLGLYTSRDPTRPPPLSTYAIVTIGGLAAAALIGAMALRLLGRRTARRLAPATPDAWWVCDRCHSVNGAGVTRCYACGAPPPGGPLMTTAARPETPQQFGATRKSG
jgi:hypothetical protein